MTNKLTCKMSDGTEWEVMCGPSEDITGQPYRAYLRPIKREPGISKRAVMTEVKTFEAIVGTTIENAVYTLAKLADEQSCIAKMDFNETTLTAYWWMGVEDNIKQCRKTYDKRHEKKERREPREGYALQRRSDKQLFMSREGAEVAISAWSHPEDFEIIKVREVLE